MVLKDKKQHFRFLVLLDFQILLIMLTMFNNMKHFTNLLSLTYHARTTRGMCPGRTGEITDETKILKLKTQNFPGYTRVYPGNFQGIRAYTRNPITVHTP